MNDSRLALFELLKRDPRYKLEAYIFIFEALNYAHEKTPLGKEYTKSETLPAVPEKAAKKSKRKPAVQEKERHLTGQELCQAIRQYAIEQYGYMALTVLNSWGVTRTGDFGEIVYNLIDIEQMRKTKDDRREDFDDVYDFQTAFVEEFKITGSAI
jgi:uncharacterized repeat protein (TIGR04138 family)